MKQKYSLPHPADLLASARGRWSKDAELMKQTGLSRATIWRIGTGRFKVSVDSIAKLMKALNRD
jgi:DNA-binding Xre family transcriptional regulator